MSLVAVAAAALSVVPPALAKGPIQVCGTTGCAPLGAEQTVVRWQLGSHPPSARVAPAAPSRYFVLRFADYGGTIAYWIPGAAVLRLRSSETAWVRARAEDLSVLTAATVGLQPYAPPRAARAAVDADLGRPVDMRAARGGTTYLRLFTLGQPVGNVPGVDGWLQIWVMGEPTPWTDGQNSLWISRRGTLLRRDGTTVRVPASIAEKIRNRAPLNG